MTVPTPAPKPLAGIRVLDLSRVLAGPFCGQMLADMGADVIKVEPPWGDENRKWGPFNAAGESCNFMSVNRGKRSLTINLKSSRGRALLDELLHTADVLLHSFLPATAAELGIVWERLHAKFPQLVMCSLSGYGEHGPLRDLPAYDVMLQAFTGIMSVTGEAGRPPVRAGVSFVDLGTSMLAYGSILTGLMARQAGLGGQHSRVSLLESGMAFLGFHGISCLETGIVPKPDGSGIGYLAPYQAFLCADAYVVTGALNDPAWRRFAQVVGLGHLAEDPDYATNEARLGSKAKLLAMLEEIFRTDTAASWVTRLLAADIPASQINRIDQAMTNEQVLANGMTFTLEREGRQPLRLMGLPFKIGAVAPATTPPPELGQHTEALLAELGYSSQHVARLREEKAI